MRLTFSALLPALFLLSSLNSCKNKDTKSIVVQEACDCLSSKKIDSNFITVMVYCQENAINNHKAMLYKELHLDTASNGDAINAMLLISTGVSLDCAFIRQNKPQIDSLLQKQTDLQADKSLMDHYNQLH